MWADMLAQVIAFRRRRADAKAHAACDSLEIADIAKPVRMPVLAAFATVKPNALIRNYEFRRNRDAFA
jgi:hypothetical protein